MDGKRRGGRELLFVFTTKPEGTKFMKTLQCSMLVEDNPNDIDLTLVALNELPLTDELSVARGGVETAGDQGA